MSNLTPDDVNLRLTSIHSLLDEEDTRLWEGLEDERISRIAGDEANKQLIDLVIDANEGTERRLSTEVVHRSEGDLSNLNSLNAVAQALSDYRIKTDLEINREKIAREQLGVDLDGRINGLEASFSHREYLMYTLINENKLITDSQVLGLDTRVRKYEQLLANITADSIQITMDNGDINMGAWTILSQAREWDLQTLAKLTDYQIKTTDDLNQALEDLQSRLPIEQDIIDKAITQLSNAPVILALDNKLESSIQDIDNLRNELVEEKSERLSDNIGLTQYVSNQISTNHTETLDILGRETIARVDSIAHETAIRQQQITELEDGMQSLATVEAVESLTTKVENIEGEVILQAEKVTKLDSYFVDSLDASQDTWFASDADTRATAWSVMNAIASEGYARSLDITSLESKIGDISAGAIESLETKVEQIGDVTFATATAVTQLQTDVNGNTAALLVQGNSINGLKAEYFVKTDVNGLIAGYGLVNDGATSAFGVNANYFYIGSEADGKEPFMVLTEPTTIGGVTYPAGTWIDVALIANATIGTAHIIDASITTAKIRDLAVDEAKIANLAVTNAKIEDATIEGAKIKDAAITSAKIDDAAITNAKIEDLAVTSGKIANLSVDTLHIKDRAVTVPLGIQQTISDASFNGNVATGWSKDVSVSFPGIETIGAGNFCTLFFRSNFIIKSDTPDNLAIEVYLGNMLIGSIVSINIPSDLIWGYTRIDQEGGGYDVWLPQSVRYTAQVMEQGSIQLAFNMPISITASTALTFRFKNNGGNRNITTTGSYVNLYLVEFKK